MTAGGHECLFGLRCTLALYYGRGFIVQSLGMVYHINGYVKAGYRGS
jgi:hypothetical protein